MTDITKYKNVSLSHDTYNLIDKMRKKMLVPNAILSRALTIMKTKKDIKKHAYDKLKGDKKWGKIVITREDAMAFVKQLEELKAEKKLEEDRGPLDLTRRVDELEKENIMLQNQLKKLQKIMIEQYRNKGAL